MLFITLSVKFSRTRPSHAHYGTFSTPAFFSPFNMVLLSPYLHVEPLDERREGRWKPLSF